MGYAEITRGLKMNDTIPRQQADRRQLQQIIAGLSEGVILIDPDQTIVWANDAALAMHGVTRLEDLGVTVTEYRERFELRYRNRHRLPDGQYPMDRVLAGEAFGDITVEVAKQCEDQSHWVHEIRGLVLTDAAGEPDCLVLVIHNATERFSAEERFERAFGANPAPAIICRLSDLRYVKVNLGFLEMTGYARDDLIGRSAYEIDVLEDAESRELAIERLNEGHTIPQMEARLKIAGGGSKFVIVAGQPIEVGDEACMLFTFMDLEPRKKAEDALRQSEERFSKAFRLAPIPMTVSALDDFRLLDVNEAFLAATGYDAEEVAGHTSTELRLWESIAARRQFEQAIAKKTSIRNLEARIHTKADVPIDCLISAEIVTIYGRPCVLTTWQDITERKRSQEELVAAIEAVMQDTSWFSRTVIEKLAALRELPGSNKPVAELADLTSREREILGLMCRGLGDDEIAAKFGVSRNTVRNHVTTIYGKIDVHRRSAAIVWARDRGFTGDAPRNPGLAKFRPRQRVKNTR
jgi:PAS domain S-box-containing protein